MVDPVTSRRLMYRLLFVALALFVLLVQVLPLTIESARWPGPDVLLVLAVAWGFRRPDYLPPWLVGAVFLTADLILQRPPGLYAALMVGALEVLRNRNALWRDLPFQAEWLIVSTIMASVILLNWIVLGLLMVDQASVGLYLIQLLGSVAIYPVVAALSVHVFGVRRIAPGQIEALG